MIPCWEPLFARFLAGSGRHVRSRPHQQFPKTAVNVKLLLPPRQSRGVSYRTLDQLAPLVTQKYSGIARPKCRDAPTRAALRWGIFASSSQLLAMDFALVASL